MKPIALQKWSEDSLTVPIKVKYRDSDDIAGILNELIQITKLFFSINLHTCKISINRYYVIKLSTPKKRKTEHKEKCLQVHCICSTVVLPKFDSSRVDFNKSTHLQFRKVRVCVAAGCKLICPFGYNEDTLNLPWLCNTWVLRKKMNIARLHLLLWHCECVSLTVWRCWTLSDLKRSYVLFSFKP